MKKPVRSLVIALVVFLIGGVGALVGRSMWQQYKHDLARKGLEFLPGVSQHIQDFHRVKIRDGRKVWEVAAQDAQYIDEEQTVLIRGALLQLYLDDGRVVGLKGDEGRILLDKREVTRVELNGGIEVSLAGYTVHTARATYYHDRELIVAPDAVEISGQALQLRGDRMEIRIADQRMTLLNQVSMQVQPALLKEAGKAPL